MEVVTQPALMTVNARPKNRTGMLPLRPTIAQPIRYKMPENESKVQLIGGTRKS